MTEIGLAGNRFKSTIGYERVVGNRFQSTIHCKDKIPNFETNIPEKEYGVSVPFSTFMRL